MYFNYHPMRILRAFLPLIAALGIANIAAAQSVTNVDANQEGKAIARQKEGFRDGRPKKYGTAQMDHAMELLKENSYNRVVEMTGISRATLAREKSRRAAEGRTS